MQTEKQDKAADKRLHAHGYKCPICGSMRTESNNGRVAYDEEFRCIDCDTRWGYEQGEPYGF